MLRVGNGPCTLTLSLSLFINSTPIVGLSIFIAFCVTPSRPFLNFPLTLLCYYCHITRFLPSQISLRVVYCSCWYFTLHWLLSPKGESISDFDFKWQRVNKFWLRNGEKYSQNLSPQSYNQPEPASIKSHNMKRTTQNTVSYIRLCNASNVTLLSGAVVTTTRYVDCCRMLWKFSLTEH